MIYHVAGVLAGYDGNDVKLTGKMVRSRAQTIDTRDDGFAEVKGQELPEGHGYLLHLIYQDCFDKYLVWALLEWKRRHPQVCCNSFFGDGGVCACRHARGFFGGGGGGAEHADKCGP